MASLNNINKIIINGDEVVKIAKHYNKNMLDECKPKTAITVQALEEAIEKNKVECDFEFNKKHETNQLFDEIIVKDIEQIQKAENVTVKIASDNTYNLQIIKNLEDKLFYYYPTALKSVEKGRVYIAGNAKNFNENVCYKLTPETFEIDGSSGMFEINKTADSIKFTPPPDDMIKCVLDEGYFTNTVGVDETELEHLFKDKACLKHITIEDCLKIEGNSKILYSPQITVYFKGGDSLTLKSILNTSVWEDDYDLDTGNKKIKVFVIEMNHFTDISPNIKEITFNPNSSKLGINLKTLNTQDLIIHYKAIDLAGKMSPTLITDKTKLYIEDTYLNCFLGQNVNVKIKIGETGEIHLSSLFFDYEDLDKHYNNTGVYPFGNFAKGQDCQYGKIIINREDLNTAVRNADTLRNMLQTILNSGANSILFEDEL